MANNRPYSHPRNAAIDARRRASQRRKRTDLLTNSALGLGLVLAVVGLLVAGPLFFGWILMLVLGGLHHSASASVPALGYWLCVGLVFVVGLIKGVTSVSVSR
jgi:hypothetical protein